MSQKESKEPTKLEQFHEACCQIDNVARTDALCRKVQTFVNAHSRTQDSSTVRSILIDLEAAVMRIINSNLE